MSGAARSTPKASPAHHVAHSIGMAPPATAPESHSVPIPMVAEMSGANTAPTAARVRTSWSFVRLGSKPRTRRSTSAAVTTDSVLPSAIPRAVGRLCPQRSGWSAAPSATAGQYRGPQRTRPARPIPAAGQRIPTSLLSILKNRPNRAATMYARARQTILARLTAALGIRLLLTARYPRIRRVDRLHDAVDPRGRAIQLYPCSGAPPDAAT